MKKRNSIGFVLLLILLISELCYAQDEKERVQRLLDKHGKQLILTEILENTYDKITISINNQFCLSQWGMKGTNLDLVNLNCILLDMKRFNVSIDMLEKKIYIHEERVKTEQEAKIKTEQEAKIKEEERFKREQEEERAKREQVECRIEVRKAIFKTMNPEYANPNTTVYSENIKLINVFFHTMSKGDNISCFYCNREFASNLIAVRSWAIVNSPSDGLFIVRVESSNRDGFPIIALWNVVVKKRDVTLTNEPQNYCISALLEK